MIHHADGEAPRAPVLAVLGAGSWGSVLASLLAHDGARVRLWARRAEHAEELATTRRNEAYVPALTLPPSVDPTSDLAAAVDGADAIFVVVPSHGLRETLAQVRPPDGAAFVSCAKGIEAGRFLRFSEIIAEYHPGADVAVLSGPNLAGEIAEGLPAAATVAASDDALAKRVQGWLQQRRFRVYTSRDVVGIEVAGAVKNVIALAAGMCDGLDLGDNAKAAIITRGLAETIRLGTHLGGETRTFYGLAGVGDLIATCASRKSRNHTAGERLARGDSLDALKASRITAEGIPTVQAVVAYAETHGLDLPIASEVHAVIFGGKDAPTAVEDLMLRASGWE